LRGGVCHMAAEAAGLGSWVVLLLGELLEVSNDVAPIVTSLTPAKSILFQGMTARR